MHSLVFLLLGIAGGSQPSSPGTGAPIVLPIVAAWGSGGSGPGQFASPVDIAIARSGSVYVTDYYNCRVQYFTPGGDYLGEWGSAGSGPGQFQAPHSVAVDDSGNLYVTDRSLQRVQKFTATGGYIRTFTDSHILNALGIAVDGQGDLYIGNDRPPGVVAKLDASGAYLLSFGSQCGWGVDVDSDGSVFVANYAQQLSEKFAPDGSLMAAWAPIGGFPEDYASGIVVDDEGHVLVATFVAGVSCLRVFSRDLVPTGTLLVLSAPAGETLDITGLDIDANGAVYIADQRNNQILKYEYLSVPARTVTWGTIKGRYR